MSDELYKLVITGYYHVDITGYKTHKGEYYIEKDFAELFQIPRQQAREIIQSSPRIIKENLSIEQATQYRDKIEKAGVSCEIHDMNEETNELSLAPD